MCCGRRCYKARLTTEKRGAAARETTISRRGSSRLRSRRVGLDSDWSKRRPLVRSSPCALEDLDDTVQTVRRVEAGVLSTGTTDTRVVCSSLLLFTINSCIKYGTVYVKGERERTLGGWRGRHCYCPLVVEFCSAAIRLLIMQ